MLQKNYSFNSLLIACLISSFAWGQASNPEPFLLSLADYSFTEWAPESPAGTYPVSTVIHRSSGNDPSLAGFNASSDYTQAYNLTSGTRVTGEGVNGISFINTGSNGNLGAFVVSLNTLGRGNIQINFTAGLITQGDGNPNPRDYRLRLQFRIGDSGPWSNFNTPPEYSSMGQIAGHIQNFENILLPTQCNDQPVVQVRWLYYQQAVNSGGTRPRIRLDDILISSEQFICVTPTQAAINLLISDIASNSATISWINGNGQNRIVIMRNTAIPEMDLPVNGTTYTANASFGTAGTELGNSFVVFNGNGNSVSVAGLQLGATYSVAVFEYSCNDVLYQTDEFPQTQFTTFAAPTISIAPTGNIILATNTGVPSQSATRTVSGSSLIENLTITASEFFEVAADASGPYSQEIAFAPIGGNVSPTDIFVRFNPGAGGNQTGTLTLASTGTSPLVVNLTGNVIISGSLPAAFPLCSGNFFFDNWPADASAGTFPANMVFHRMSQNDPILTSIDVADYTDAYNGTSGTRINGLGAEGISFINTGTAGNLGTAVLGLNTIGRNNITVSFLASMMTQGAGNPTPRDYGLRLQYRVGGETWTDFANPVEYITTNQTNGHIQNFENIVLPSECENQPAVYLRWFYYQIAANSGGSRPRIRLDNISVSSSAALPALSDVIATPDSEADMVNPIITGAINTLDEGINVWTVSLRDGGAAGDQDNLPTLLSVIEFLKGAEDNTVSWINNIGNAALFEGETKIADGQIQADKIVFSNLTLNIPDNQAKTISLVITMADDGLVEDQTNLQFRLTQESFTISNACNSSRFANFSISSDPDKNLIEVDATQLNFTTVTMTIVNNVAFSAAVQATDINNNIDRSSRQVSITATPAQGNGQLSSAGGLGPINMLNGTYTWNDLIINLPGMYTLTAETSDEPSLMDEREIVVNDGTNIFSPSSTQALAVFPNPNSERMLNFTENISGQITDLSGRVLMLFEDTKRIEVNKFPVGIYYVRSNKGFAKIVLQ
ncbi:MAG: T9SS type A sorting domain-containing protein [Flavobacteriales bacterium]